MNSLGFMWKPFLNSLRFIKAILDSFNFLNRSNFPEFDADSLAVRCCESVLDKSSTLSTSHRASFRGAPRQYRTSACLLLIMHSLGWSSRALQCTNWLLPPLPHPPCSLKDANITLIFTVTTTTRATAKSGRDDPGTFRHVPMFSSLWRDLQVTWPLE